MVTLEKESATVWQDNCPVVMVKDFHNPWQWHYSKLMTDLLRNNDLEAFRDVIHMQSLGEAEVH